MKALVLIDFQKEWADKNSEYYVGDLTAVTDRVNKLIVFCRENGYVVIFTRHVEDSKSSSFADGSANSTLLDGIGKRSEDSVIIKNRISPFFKTDMDITLEGVSDVVVCGILTNLCVRSFIEGAYDRDMTITVIPDCCVALDESTHDFTLKDLKETREEIAIVPSDEFLSLKTDTTQE